MSELSPSGGSEGYEACDDVVDVGDNAEIADIVLIGHFLFPSLWPWIVRLMRSPVVWMI